MSPYHARHNSINLPANESTDFKGIDFHTGGLRSSALELEEGARPLATVAGIGKQDSEFIPEKYIDPASVHENAKSTG